MSYDYLKASPTYGQTQKQIYVGLFQETLNQQFTNASDVWTVSEEDSIGSQTYHDVDVRIVTHVISSATGKYLGDDYKQILFSDLGHSVGLGFMYQFSNNYWVTINTERIENLASSTYVKRCNNTLRWIGNNGEYFSEPCNLDYEILRNVNNESPSNLIVTPSGRFEIIVQFNDRTNTIRPNQRFLFGNADNWTAYKIVGGGINNYQNTETLDDTTVGFIKLTVVVDYVSDNDDTTNGIAYTEKQDYALSISPSSVAGIYGTTGIKLYPTVTLNGDTVSRDVLWSSSATGIANIGATGVTGLVTLGNTGSAVITGVLKGNTGVSDTVAVTVSSSSSNIYQIVFSPNTNYILEGESQVYTVYLYTNGVKDTGATFTYSVNARTVPTENFGFSYTATPGNGFTVQNIERCMTDYITVSCTTIISAVPHIGTLDVNLRGSW